MNKYVLLILLLFAGSAILFLYNTTNIKDLSWKVPTEWQSKFFQYISHIKFGKGRKIYSLNSLILLRAIKFKSN